MIHSLADYSNENGNQKVTKNIQMNINQKPKKYQNHKSLGKYPVSKNNNINSNEKSKFQAFRGRGKAVSMVKTEGLKVNKFVQNKPDKNKQIVKIDIRLFGWLVYILLPSVIKLPTLVNNYPHSVIKWPILVKILPTLCN